MKAYYNEFDPKAAAWLRELVREGHIADGDVDTRSITEVQPSDLEGYGQVHFFAGIGGWSLALRLAGVPDTEPVWTGSCPCQPYSVAGKGKGNEDERHLWPDMFRLVRQRRPARVLGEQVAAAIGHGWLDGVFADLEGEGYACGAAVLGAHSVGAPHIRQRVWWVADAERGDSQRRGHDVHGASGSVEVEARERQRIRLELGTSSGDRGVADASIESGERDTGRFLAPQTGVGGTRQQIGHHAFGPGHGGGDRGVGQSKQPGLEGHAGDVNDRNQPGRVDSQQGGSTAAAGGIGPWSNYIIIPCGDGKARRIEPGLSPLVDGLPGRVGLLRGYGNAIVPQVAAEFIRAVMGDVA